MNFPMGSANNFTFIHLGICQEIASSPSKLVAHFQNLDPDEANRLLGNGSCFFATRHLCNALHNENLKIERLHEAETLLNKATEKFAEHGASNTSMKP